MFYPQCILNIKAEAFLFYDCRVEKQKRVIESILDSYEGLE
jgi:hypothetical protein